MLEACLGGTNTSHFCIPNDLLYATVTMTRKRQTSAQKEVVWPSVVLPSLSHFYSTWVCLEKGGFANNRSPFEWVKYEVFNLWIFHDFPMFIVSLAKFEKPIPIHPCSTSVSQMFPRRGVHTSWKDPTRRRPCTTRRTSSAAGDRSSRSKKHSHGSHGP